MKHYIPSFCSIKKITYKNLSPLAVWDRSSSFDKTSEIRRFAKLKNSRVGRYSRVNPHCNLSNTTVGDFTAIGYGSDIGLGRHPLIYASTHSIFYKRNNMRNDWARPIKIDPVYITIGSDVWIGIKSIILDGITIGDGAVIGAGSVVTKDVPPYAIVGGAPAKLIRYRFDPEVIARLLSIRWWDFSDDQIAANLEFFRDPALSLASLDKYFPQR